MRLRRDQPCFCTACCGVRWAHPSHGFSSLRAGYVLSVDETNVASAQESLHRYTWGEGEACTHSCCSLMFSGELMVYSRTTIKNFAHFSGFAICLHWSKNVSYHYLCSRMRRSEPDRDAGRVSAGWASVFPEAGNKDLWSSHLKCSKKQHYLVVRPRIQVSLWRWNAVSWATLIWDLVPF